MHPLFTQVNEDLGNRLNAGRPADDFPTYGETITKAIAGVVSANGTAEDPRRMRRELRSGSSPISCLTRWEHQPCLVRRVERPLEYGQRAGRDVLHSSNTPVHLGIGKELVTSKPSKSFPTFLPSST